MPGNQVVSAPELKQRSGILTDNHKPIVCDNPHSCVLKQQGYRVGKKEKEPPLKDFPSCPRFPMKT
jgi:hypothetical protein